MSATTIRFVEGLNKEKATFVARLVSWDPKDPTRTMKSRNGVVYDRKALETVTERAIKEEGGIPFLWNHILDEHSQEVLGIVNDFEITEEGLFIKGDLNTKKKRVVEEILPGFVTHVSLQVMADQEENEGFIYATPNSFVEISAVPTAGFANATLEAKLTESINSANKRLKESTFDETDNSGFRKLDNENPGMNKKQYLLPKFRDAKKAGRYWILDGKRIAFEDDDGNIIYTESFGDEKSIAEWDDLLSTKFQNANQKIRAINLFHNWLRKETHGKEIYPLILKANKLADEVIEESPSIINQNLNGN